MKIGDKVPYKNRQKNIETARVSEFNHIGNVAWFHGTDIRTGAAVRYPVKRSEELSIKIENEKAKTEGN